MEKKNAGAIIGISIAFGVITFTVLFAAVYFYHNRRQNAMCDSKKIDDDHDKSQTTATQHRQSFSASWLRKLSIWTRSDTDLPATDADATWSLPISRPPIQPSYPVDGVPAKAAKILGLPMTAGLPQTPLGSLSTPQAATCLSFKTLPEPPRNTMSGLAKAFQDLENELARSGATTPNVPTIRPPSPKELSRPFDASRATLNLPDGDVSAAPDTPFRYDAPGYQRLLGEASTEGIPRRLADRYILYHNNYPDGNYF